MALVIDKAIKPIIDSLEANLPFVAELLQADVKLFIRSQGGVYLCNYYQPTQDSISTNLTKGTKLEQHKDFPVRKAFKTGNHVIGQYGLVINNRPIQEFAYPIMDGKDIIAVVALERDIYLTRSILGRHWDMIADGLIRALRDESRSSGQRFPRVSPGEGALIIEETPKGKSIFFAEPLATNLLSEVAESSDQLIGRTLGEIFTNCIRKEKGQNLQESIVLVEEVTLRQRTIKLRYIPFDGNYSVVLIKDVSEIKVRETLLREIHHRVKNNLQTVVSLLNMQRRRNPDLKEAFTEAISRINSITVVHEYLSHSSNVEMVDLGQLVSSIIKESLSSFGEANIKLNYNCPEKVFVTSEKATKFSLIINELLMNSLEHAGDKMDQIDVDLIREKGSLTINIADNGKGFGKDFDYKHDSGLGWEIIKTLAQESLNASILLENIKQGARVCIKAPMD